MLLTGASSNPALETPPQSGFSQMKLKKSKTKFINILKLQLFMQALITNILVLKSNKPIIACQ